MVMPSVYFIGFLDLKEVKKISRSEFEGYKNFQPRQKLRVAAKTHFLRLRRLDLLSRKVILEISKLDYVNATAAAAKAEAALMEDAGKRLE